MIKTMVSGGQTGADRAALDVALAWGIEVRGWVPRGRIAEDGIIAERYPGLRETASDDPAERTRLNIHDADGSLIISHAALRGGSLLALETALQLPRPVLHIDLSRVSLGEAVTECAEWIRAHRITVLGVGGPRKSEDPLIYDATVMLLSGVLGSLADGRQTIAD